MVYGQVVIGPPGSGKTTYCNGMSQFLSLIGRKVAVINLDPANDALPYECAVNIEDLVKLSDVMNEHSLGPNGGDSSFYMCYYMCIINRFVIGDDELLKVKDDIQQVLFIAWITLRRILIGWSPNWSRLLKANHYLLFDFPGQVELFFLHSNAKKVIMKLIKKFDLRLTAVHLVDAHLCSDPGKYVSALLLSLSTMLHLELPHVNVLSKIDLIESYGKLPFNLDFYTDVQDLSYLQHVLDQDPRSAKYGKLTKELCQVIEDYSLVNFTTLAIQDKESVGNLVKLIDKTNGYIFAGIEGSVVEFSKIAAGPVDWDYFRYPFLPRLFLVLCCLWFNSIQLSFNAPLLVMMLRGLDSFQPQGFSKRSKLICTSLRKQVRKRHIEEVHLLVDISIGTSILKMNSKNSGEQSRETFCKTARRVDEINLTELWFEPFMFMRLFFDAQDLTELTLDTVELVKSSPRTH
ncbi:GPN-loop GTPase [Dillenia turbinata]|uniref:GPN-loop GTPase n=1 Tax=Dillenia turbinata TaxID=194707 RepID=A0AAN8VT39_9MAGN